MATKIRTLDSDNDKIVEKYKQETNSGDCEIQTWLKPEKRTRIYPPEGTVAIVVDVRNNRGAINIHQTQSNDWVDQVGTEETGKLVIVPWTSSWYYYSVGALVVGYIVEK